MKIVITTIVAIAIVLGLTILGVRFLEENAPEAEKKERVEKPPVVEVQVVSKGDQEFTLKSEGVVLVRRDIILSAQVGGKLVKVDENFEVGATFNKGDLIAEIDPVDYMAAVAQSESTLAEAELALVQETARAQQAERDWKKIGGGKDASELVLRIPFLNSAKARLAAAVAALEKAEADLARTRIFAPFDCRVRAVNLNVGATVVPGAQLGTVYDPGELMIRLPFSLDDYAQLPDNAEIRLSSTIGGRLHEWDAEVMWELGEVDQRTLSAYVLAKILPKKDDSSRFRLPSPGIFLNASLVGAVLPGVVGVPRSAIRGENRVFVFGEESKLEVRELVIARSTADWVFATQGIADGEKVILTKLDMPIAGMTIELPKGDQQEEQFTSPN